jgi:hypothetical protein
MSAAAALALSREVEFLDERLEARMGTQRVEHRIDQHQCRDGAALHGAPVQSVR